MSAKNKRKVVIVTAASRGIGKAIAKKFAAQGACVLLSSRNEESLLEAAEDIKRDTNVEVFYSVCDITKKQDIINLIRKAVENFGTIDVLVNNCGGPPSGAFEQCSDEAWKLAFESTLLSYVRTIRGVLPYMRKQKSGHIVNIASSSFKQPLENMVLSNTFRVGLLGLTKTLSMELARDNILINTIGPGRIATDRAISFDRMKATKLGITYEEAKKISEREVPLGRYGHPQELANLVAFLCSDENTYISGQAILVDGGLVSAI